MTIDRRARFGGALALCAALTWPLAARDVYRTFLDPAIPRHRATLDILERLEEDTALQSRERHEGVPTHIEQRRVDAKGRFVSGDRGGLVTAPFFGVAEHPPCGPVAGRSRNGLAKSRGGAPPLTAHRVDEAGVVERAAGRLVELRGESKFAKGVSPESVPRDEACEVVVQRRVVRRFHEALEQVERRAVLGDPRVEEAPVDVPGGQGPGESGTQGERAGEARAGIDHHGVPFVGVGRARPTSRTFPSRT
ncbi:MAG: hypothetical protein ACXVID_03775 [Thermoanaerobaculia bacterium]